MKMRHLLLLFIPAFLVVGLALFVRVIQYEPLYPDETQDGSGILAIPIQPTDPTIGSARAPTTIILFEDLGCPGCKLQDEVLTELVQAAPDKIRVVFKGLAVTQFPYPTDEAQSYAFCAHKQGKFTQFKTAAFAQQNNLSTSALKAIASQIGLNETKLAGCLQSGEAVTYLETNEQLAVLLNIQSVPAVFVNNQQTEPPSSAEGWKALLNL